MATFPQSCWAVLHNSERTVGHVALTFRIRHEDDAWQSICTELKVPSFGNTPGEAMDNVIDATIGYLNELEHLGEREQVFKERGLALRAGFPTKRRTTSSAATVRLSEGESVSRLDIGLTAVA